MADSSRALGSADASGYLTGYPSPSQTSSEEEDPSEYMGSDQEVSSQRTSTPSRSRSSPTTVLPQPLPQQPTLGDAYLRFRATAPTSVPIPAPAVPQPPGRTYHLSGDPYAAGPSRVSDHYTWEHLMEREIRQRHEIAPTHVVTGVPAQQGAERILDDRDVINALIADRRYDRASLALFERRLYLNTKGTRRLAPHTLRATETSQAAYRMASRAMAWIYFLVFVLITIIVALLAYIIRR